MWFGGRIYNYRGCYRVTNVSVLDDPVDNTMSGQVPMNGLKVGVTLLFDEGPVTTLYNLPEMSYKGIHSPSLLHDFLLRVSALKCLKICRTVYNLSFKSKTSIGLYR